MIYRPDKRCMIDVLAGTCFNRRRSIRLEKEYPIEYNQNMKYIKKIIEKETELSIKFNNKSLTPTNIPPLGQKERNEVKIK